MGLRSKIFVFLAYTGLCFAPLSVLAAGAVNFNGGANGVGSIDQGIITGTVTGCDFQTGQLTRECIPNFVAHVIDVVFQLTGTFFILNILYAGYQIALGPITENKEAGKNRLRWALIGAFLTVCSFVLVDAVLNVIIP